MIWDGARAGIRWFVSVFPSPSYPTGGFTSTAALVERVNATLVETGLKYHYKKLADYYDYTKDLKALNDTSKLEFGSSEFNETASEILQTMHDKVYYFLFKNFNAEGLAEIDDTKDYGEKIQLYNDGFKFVFQYFFIAAGSFLIMLAVMKTFGTVRKTGDEWASIVLRVLAGAALPCTSLVAFKEAPDAMSGYRFDNSGWIIPIATFTFLLVLIGDNLLASCFGVAKRYRRRSSATTMGDEESPFGGDETHGGPLRSITIKSHPMKQRRIPRRNSDDSATILTKNAAAHSTTRQGGYSHVDQNERGSWDGTQSGPNSPTTDRRRE